MAAAQRKLVHKQFNSPMGLYSAQNVKETLNRELKAFGDDGIEVDDQILKPANLSNSAVLKALEEDEMDTAYPGYKRVAWPPVGETRTYREYTPQPQNPQQQQQHHPQESTQQQQKNQGGGNFVKSQPTNQYPYLPQQQQQPQYQQQEPQQQQQKFNQQQQQKSFHPEPIQSAEQTNSNSFSVSSVGQSNPLQSQSKYQTQYQLESINQKQQEKSQIQSQTVVNLPQLGSPQISQLNQIAPSEHHSNRWSHVRSPVPVRSGYIQQPTNRAPSNPPFENNQSNYGATYQNVPNQPYAQKIYQSVPVENHQQSPIGPSYYQQQQQPQQQLSSSSPLQQQQSLHQGQENQYQENRHQSPHPDTHYNIYSLQNQPQQQQKTYSPQAYRDESPGIITLRKEAPVTQRPSPVYTSQPAAASYRGGSNMRGDLKWPPPEYKAQAQEANEERRKLALGPVFRPRRINKDYTQFFAKNAINNYYPSYKVPPGTQHVVAEF